MLDQLVDAAIQEGYYTADGERVVLSLKSLIDLGLVDASAANRLKHRLKAWNIANSVDMSEDISLSNDVQTQNAFDDQLSERS